MGRPALRLLGTVSLWWTLNGLATAAELHTTHDARGAALTWRCAITIGMTGAWLWIPLTLGLFRLAQRHPIERPRRARAFALHGLAVLGVLVARPAAVVALNPWIHWYDAIPPASELLLSSLWNNFFLGWLLVGVSHAVVFAARARQRDYQAGELRGRLARAQLDALSAQLNPHFLFNALNSIAELVHEDPDAADGLIVRLSQLLRHSLSSAGTAEVELREELRLVRDYLDIEQARLGERLRLEWSIAAETTAARVPHLVLLPVVENAIRHAVAPRPTPSRVRISAERAGGELVLEVRDDGPGLEPPVPARGGHGIGLANTRARLEHLYGREGRLLLSAAPEGGTVVRVRIPFTAEAA